MPRRMGDPRYREWYWQYAGETERPHPRNVPTDDMAKRNETRRRIEDVREGLRLDRDVLGEVWE